MMVLATLISQLAGFACVALSMGKHHGDLFGAPPSRLHKLTLAGGGWLLLGVSVVPAVAEEGAAVGVALWFGAATLAALAVAMGLTFAPGAAACRRRRAPARRPAKQSTERRSSKRCAFR